MSKTLLMLTIDSGHNRSSFYPLFLVSTTFLTILDHSVATFSPCTVYRLFIFLVTQFAERFFLLSILVVLFVRHVVALIAIAVIFVVVAAVVVIVVDIIILASGLLTVFALATLLLLIARIFITVI